MTTRHPSCSAFLTSACAALVAMTHISEPQQGGWLWLCWGMMPSQKDVFCFRVHAFLNEHPLLRDVPFLFSDLLAWDSAECCSSWLLLDFCQAYLQYLNIYRGAGVPIFMCLCNDYICHDWLRKYASGETRIFVLSRLLQRGSCLIKCY